MALLQNQTLSHLRIVGPKRDSDRLKVKRDVRISLNLSQGITLMSANCIPSTPPLPCLYKQVSQ